MQPVNQVDGTAICGVVFQPRGFDEPIFLTGPPCVAIGYTQIVVYLLVDEFVAIDVLVQIPLNAIQTGISCREGYPQIGAAAFGDQQASTVQRLLTQAFVTYGLPDRILCDNGSPWANTNPEHRWTGLGVWLLDIGVVQF